MIYSETPPEGTKKPKLHPELFIKAAHYLLREEKDGNIQSVEHAETFCEIASIWLEAGFIDQAHKVAQKIPDHFNVQKGRIMAEIAAERAKISANPQTFIEQIRAIYSDRRIPADKKGEILLAGLSVDAFSDKELSLDSIAFSMLNNEWVLLAIVEHHLLKKNIAGAKAVAQRPRTQQIRYQCEVKIAAAEQKIASPQNQPVTKLPVWTGLEQRASNDLEKEYLAQAYAECGLHEDAERIIKTHLADRLEDLIILAKHEKKQDPSNDLVDEDVIKVARAQFEDGGDENPENVLMYLCQSGHCDQAIELFEILVENNQTYAYIASTMARELTLQDHKKAQEYWEKSNSIDDPLTIAGNLVQASGVKANNIASLPDIMQRDIPISLVRTLPLADIQVITSAIQGAAENAAVLIAWSKAAGVPQGALN